MEIKVSLTPPDNRKISEKILDDHQYTKFFKSRIHEIAFYLKANNSKFDAELEVKSIHKEIVKEAKNLKLEFKKIFHPDKKRKEEDLNFNEITQDIDAFFKRVSGGKLK
ncbi:hypothetical protein [Atlantibacter hermannii]|uniref:hypothetical protein n=1 Tax=Atlantibacter hermannii TaxID=565 RepID=UPI00339694D5